MNTSSPRKLSTSIALLSAGVLTLAGCSRGPATADSPAPSSVTGSQVLAATASARTTLPAPVASDRTSITAEGIGEVTGTPDVVAIDLGVATNAASAGAALDDNNKRAAAVIAVLKKNGVAATDLQTDQLSIDANYNGKNQITGYQVTNMITAKLRHISAAGSIIDAVGRAAGNAVRVQQLSFSVGDDSSLMAAARAQAVKKAQAQAKQMADAAGVRLGRIHSITETSTPVSPASDVRATYAAASSSVPIESGSQQLRVVVDVVYEIAP